MRPPPGMNLPCIPDVKPAPFMSTDFNNQQKDFIDPGLRQGEEDTSLVGTTRLLPGRLLRGADETRPGNVDFERDPLPHPKTPKATRSNATLHFFQFVSSFSLPVYSD